MAKIKKPILYSPAGNIKKAEAAIYYGADGIYLGLDKFGLRKTDNIDFEELRSFINKCNNEKVRVDITLNAFLSDFEIEDFNNYLKTVLSLNVDSIIISDPGVIIIYEELIKNLKEKNLIDKVPSLTLSTQANTSNFYSMKFWNQQGISRIVAARELSLKELYQINKKKFQENFNFEIEVFIHGAMCVSISGRCLLSLYMTNKKFSKKGSDYPRDANRGQCVHPCRFAYIVEQSRENEYFPIEEDGRFSYILSSKDLCLFPYIPLLMFANLDALKIEGRMKSAFYTSSITHAYRSAIEQAYKIFNNIEIEEDKLLIYFDNPELFLNDYPNWSEFVKNYSIFTELASHRLYTTGFYFKQEYPDFMMPPNENKLIQNYILLAESLRFEEIVKIDFLNKFVKNSNITKNQFVIFSKNSFSKNINSLFIFSKRGIEKINDINILDLSFNKIDSIYHSNYYIIELENYIIEKLNLKKEDIFFLYCIKEN